MATEIDGTLAYARRLYLHYAHISPGVATDFSRLVYRLERTQATLEAQQEALAKAHKDAERYRWLRVNVVSASWVVDGDRVENLTDTYDPSELDAAIDAAMKENGQ